MTWDEGKHRRDAEGKFTHTSVGNWAQRIADQIGRADRVTAARRAAARGEHPEGHGAAKARLQQLWDIPDRRRGIERTDAQQAELEDLEQAFDTYRKTLGLRGEREHGHSDLYHADDAGRATFSQYGEMLHHGPITSDPPPAAQWGYRRVGEHPRGVGRVGSANTDEGGTPSTHAKAGGLWINPDNPGTRHAPRYLNDYGTPVAELRPKDQPSYLRKVNLVERRRGDLRGRPEDLASDTLYTRQVALGGRKPRVTERWGRFGYHAREEGWGNEGTTAFVGHMKRLQSRARQEMPREARRRTPRGTAVDGWMQHVNDRIEQTRGRRG